MTARELSDQVLTQRIREFKKTLQKDHRLDKIQEPVEENDLDTLFNAFNQAMQKSGKQMIESVWMFR